MHELEYIHHVLDRRAGAEAPALIDCDGTQLSNGELRSAVTETSDRLRENGVVAGDRVLIVAENCTAFIAGALGNC